MWRTTDQNRKMSQFIIVDSATPTQFKMAATTNTYVSNSDGFTHAEVKFDASF